MKRGSLPIPFLAFALCGALSPSASSQETPARDGAEPLSLSAALQVALATNPELRAASGRIAAAAGRALQAKAWANPELELGAEDWPLRSGRGFSDAKRTIGIAQPLPYPGKRALDQAIGRAGVKISEAELLWRRSELIREVKTSFFRVLAYERLVAVSAELVTAGESSAAIARKRVEAGAAAYQEQLRAEVLLEQARTEWCDVQSDLGAARQVFATLLGRPDLSDARLQGALDEPPETRLIERPATEQLAHHPSLLAAQMNLDRTELGLRRVRLDPYPDVRVGVAGGRSGETDQSILQLSLSLPLPLLNRGKGLQQEARANASVAQAELHAMQQRLQRDWANAARRYRTAIEQVTTYRDRILPKATAALQLVQTGFETGKFNFIDLIDTQRTTAQVRQVYYHKLLEMKVAHAELEALLAGREPPTTSEN